MRRSGLQAFWSDLGKAAVMSAALSALIVVGGVRAAEQAATNIDVMQHLTAQVIGELYGKFSPTLAGHAVQLRPGGSTEDYAFVTNVFREELARAGVTMVDTSARADSAQALVLQFQNVVFDLKYVDAHKSHVIGGKRVDRRAAVRMVTTLTDPSNGRVVWVGEAERSQSDDIDYSDAARIEQGAYKFNQPVVPSAGWGKYAEPVFVTGIIVGLIYLFFSNQSNN